MSAPLQQILHGIARTATTKHLFHTASVGVPEGPNYPSSGTVNAFQIFSSFTSSACCVFLSFSFFNMSGKRMALEKKCQGSWEICYRGREPGGGETQSLKGMNSPAEPS